MFREEKGITLVALVLTIVVLLILSGISIAVVIQNTDGVSHNPSKTLNDLNPNVATTTHEDAETKVKLIFELLEANYQTELARGTIAERNEKFTAANIIEALTEYNVKGNTESSLGVVDISNGVTINYGNDYTFIVKVSEYGIVSVMDK